MVIIRFFLIIVLSITVTSNIKSQSKILEKNVNFGINYFYSPKNYGVNYTLSTIIGINFDGKTFIGSGIDLSTPYYNNDGYKGIFIQIQKMIKKDNASPFLSIRHGIGIDDRFELQSGYTNFSTGIIEHKEFIDIRFEMSYNHHKYKDNDLVWVSGFEMLIGIIF